MADQKKQRTTEGGGIENHNQGEEGIGGEGSGKDWKGMVFILKGMEENKHETN